MSSNFGEFGGLFDDLSKLGERLGKIFEPNPPKPQPKVTVQPDPNFEQYLAGPRLRRFAINRTKDVSGVSGTGYIATGVQWPDGRCALRWGGDKACTSTWDSIEDLIGVHGHGDLTKIVWLD